MKNKIMIIGGHGHVGSVITKNISHKYPGKVILAGRNSQKMADYLAENQLNLKTQVFDITKEPDLEMFETIKLVVVCIDQKNTKFVEFCNNNAIDYVDVSANSAFYHQLSQLNFSKKSSVVYSVGLAPGLTNLMAHAVAKKLPNFTELAIKVILGLGDSHGDAAIDWTFKHLNQGYEINGQKVKPFSLKNQVRLVNHKDLPVYNFDFSDQHSLKQVWPERKIMTYLGFDLGSVTHSLHYLQKLKVLPVIENPKVMSFSKKIMAKGSLGSDSFVLQVTASEGREGQSLTVRGAKEGVVTGEIASVLIERVYQSQDSLGFVQIDDYLTFEELAKALPQLQLID